MPSCYTVSREELPNHLTRRLFSSSLSLPLLGKPFIEARHGGCTPAPPPTSLPLLGKPFIEAPPPCGTAAQAPNRFPFWGSPSLRQAWRPHVEMVSGDRFPFWGSPSLRPVLTWRAFRAASYRFPFWGSPSLRLAGLQPRRDGHRISLPLLGKPFIEAVRTGACGAACRRYRFPFWGSPSLRHHRRSNSRPLGSQIASPSGEALH